jgi:tetratricopeptide (TPR) repeat protein
MPVNLPDLREAALQAEREDRYVAAILLLEPYLRANPVDGFAWLTLAAVYKSVGRFRDAGEALQNALNYAPDAERWTVQARIAMLHTKCGRLEEAEEWFCRATSNEEARKSGWPLILRGANLNTLERHDEAELILREAVHNCSEDDELDEAHHNLGIALLGQRKYQEAKESFTNSLELDPTFKAGLLALKFLEGRDSAAKMASEFESRI